LGVLYIVSAEEAAGKTAIGAGLAINLINAGKKVGYLKPQAAEKGQADGDITFMGKVLGQPSGVNAPDVTKSKDVVLVEARLGTSADDAVSKATYGAAREMKAKAIAVEAFTGQSSKFIDVYKGFGESLLGVVLNKVPQSFLKGVRDEATKQFGAAGIKVLGVIPENRVLLAITVGELAECIQGKILNSAGMSGELVENYMLGALVVDSGLDYFGRKSNKAAVIRQDRPDMQLAALETPTKCLVLSGSSQPPVYNVLYKAESKGIPIIATGANISDIVTNIENALMKTRLSQEKKLSKLAEIVKQNLDMKAIG
jgi:BioD-like phosphotransacetylase family protein